jgi:hypothetical protein
VVEILTPLHESSIPLLELRNQHPTPNMGDQEHSLMSPKTTVKLGQPRPRTTIALGDALSLLAQPICFSIGTAAVASHEFSFWVGETRQLIVIGLVLSIMGWVTFKEAQKLLVVLEARFGQSSLQNYDGKSKRQKETQFLFGNTRGK